MNARPASEARVRVPLVAASVNRGVAASDVGDRERPERREHERGVLVAPPARPGTVLTGASLTAVDGDRHRVGVGERAAGAGEAAVVGRDGEARRAVVVQRRLVAHAVQRGVDVGDACRARSSWRCRRRRPGSEARGAGEVSVPLVTVSVTSIGRAGVDVGDRDGLPPAENTSAVSSLVDCAAGTAFTGASFTAVTLMLTVSVSLSAPPAPVLPGRRW